MTVSVNGSGFSDPIDLSSDADAVTGVTASFNPNPVPDGQAESTLTVAVQNDVSAGDYTLNITGQESQVSSSTSSTIIIVASTTTHRELDDGLNALREDSRVETVVQEGLVEVPPQSRIAGSSVSPKRLPQPNGGTPSGWTWESQPQGGNYGMELSPVPQMWNLNPSIETRGDSTVTGIFDVGFEDESDHDDLTYAQDSSTPTHYHGTHVAGTINAIFDNGIGVDGVNPFADLVLQTQRPDTSMAR